MIINDSYKAIAELDLEPIKFKLTHESSGKGWSQAKADAIDLEYRRFLYLHLAFPYDKCSPTEDVDTFWHYHILDTMKYAADCMKAFGYFLHHYPYLGLLDGSGEDEAAQAAACTRELYQITFDEAYIRAEAYGIDRAGAGAPGSQTARCHAFCASAPQARPTGRHIQLAKGLTRELRESQAKLQLSHQNLRRLAVHADQIKEGERKRIAREIHDDLGQNLLALRIDADMLATRTRAKHSRLHERARAMLYHIDLTIKSVRHIINDLRPHVLDLGLSAAVEWQIGEFRRRTGIECDLFDEPNEIVVNEQAATAFFRILQESLSNIVRHAQASRVRVVLRATGRSLTMTVSDNGIGLGTAGRAKSGSFGLVGIEERISILGGSFSIHSSQGEGTTVSVSVPLGQIQARSLSPSDDVHGPLSEHA